MKTFKKKILGSIVAFSLCANPMFASGIPTVDVASVAQQLLSYVQSAMEIAEQAKRWKETVQHYKNQVNAFKNQIQAQTGAKDLSSAIEALELIFKDSRDQYKTMQNFQNQIFSNPMGFANSVGTNYSKYMIFDNCKTAATATSRNICIATNAIDVSALADTQKALERYEKYDERLEQLAKDAGTTTDIKHSQDIANQIALYSIEMQKEAQLTALKTRDYEMARNQIKEQTAQRFAKELSIPVDSVSIMKQAFAK